MSRAPSGPALLAVYARPGDLAEALDAVKARRRPFTVYSPVRDPELLDRVGLPPSPVRFATLLGFFTGTASGFGLCAFTALRWKIIVSGKPILSWVPFTVVAFELSILLGVLATLATLAVLARLPRFRLPPWYDPRFSSDRFGLLVELGPSDDGLGAALRAAGAEDVREVAA